MWSFWGMAGNSHDGGLGDSAESCRGSRALDALPAELWLVVFHALEPQETEQVYKCCRIVCKSFKALVEQAYPDFPQGSSRPTSPLSGWQGRVRVVPSSFPTRSSRPALYPSRVVLPDHPGPERPLPGEKNEQALLCFMLAAEGLSRPGHFVLDCQASIEQPWAIISGGPYWIDIRALEQSANQGGRHLEATQIATLRGATCRHSICFRNQVEMLPYHLPQAWVSRYDGELSQGGRPVPIWVRLRRTRGGHDPLPRLRFFWTLKQERKGRFGMFRQPERHKGSLTATHNGKRWTIVVD